MCEVRSFIEFSLRQNYIPDYIQMHDCIIRIEKIVCVFKLYLLECLPLYIDYRQISISLIYLLNLSS